MFQLFAIEVKKLLKLLIEILIEILIEMKKIIIFLIKTIRIIIFLIKTIRILRTIIYRLSCVTKNTTLISYLPIRLMEDCVWALHVTSLSAVCQDE